MNTKTKRILIISAIVVGVLLIGKLTGITNKVTDKEQSNTTSQTAENTIETVSEVTEEPANVLPDLKPVDVYLNFEDQGFKTEKTSNEAGILWNSKMEEPGISYEVTTFSTNVNFVESVRGLANIDPSSGKNAEAVKPFIKFVSSVPYEGADPDAVAAWIDQVYNEKNSSKEFNGVTFELDAPTQWVRMIRISK